MTHKLVERQAAEGYVRAASGVSTYTQWLFAVIGAAVTTIVGLFSAYSLALVVMLCLSLGAVIALLLVRQRTTEDVKRTKKEMDDSEASVDVLFGEHPSVQVSFGTVRLAVGPPSTEAAAGVETMSEIKKLPGGS